MTNKEAYEEFKTFKELYRSITKLGNFFVIRGTIYFDFLESREFFLTYGTLTSDSIFANFARNHIFFVNFDDIKAIRDAKKKDVIDVILTETSLTYKIQEETGIRDIMFTHNPDLCRDALVLEEIEITGESREIPDDVVYQDVLELFDADKKILEIPTKSMIIINKKITEKVSYRYSELDDTEGNIVEVTAKNPAVDLSVRMITL